MAKQYLTGKVLVLFTVLCFIPGILLSSNSDHYNLKTIDHSLEIQPKYVLTDIQGNPIDEKKGVRIAGFKGVKITAGQGHRVLELHVTLARGQEKMTSFISYGETLYLNQFQTLLQPEDRIVVEVKKIVEKTAAGDKAVPVSGETFTIPVY